MPMRCATRLSLLLLLLMQEKVFWMCSAVCSICPFMFSRWAHSVISIMLVAAHRSRWSRDLPILISAESGAFAYGHTLWSLRIHYGSVHSANLPLVQVIRQRRRTWGSRSVVLVTQEHVFILACAVWMTDTHGGERRGGCQFTCLSKAQAARLVCDKTKAYSW